MKNTTQSSERSKQSYKAKKIRSLARLLKRIVIRFAEGDFGGYRIIIGERYLLHKSHRGATISGCKSNKIIAIASKKQHHGMEDILNTVVHECLHAVSFGSERDIYAATSEILRSMDGNDKLRLMRLVFIHAKWES